MKEKDKKPFYKKWWFWIIVIIVVAIGSTGDDETQSKEEPKEDAAETAVEVEEEKDEEPEKPKEEPEEEKSPLQEIEKKKYITSIEIDDDGVVNATIDAKSELTPNFVFDRAVDILEDMKTAFEDEEVNGYYARTMINVIDNKGNESEEEGFNLYYTREDFETLNYDNFYNLSYSEPYRIFNESTSYLINPVLYRELKSEYTSNLTHEHNKPNYVEE